MALWMYEIEGGRPLHGRLRVSGSKNASLPLLTAALLANEPSVIADVPRLRDIGSMIELLGHLGARCEWTDDGLLVDPAGFHVDQVPYDVMRKMRASFYAMGPMLARLGRAKVSLPGGCAIGDRPVDLHLHGFKGLGAQLTQSSGYVLAKADQLVGGEVSLLGAFGTSVGATCNVMMAATLAKGETIIRHAAREPEVVELARFLSAMGAQISGAGSDNIRIQGQEKLSGIHWQVSPDRIEAGTWMVATLVTDGDVVLENVDRGAMRPLLDVLLLWGAELTELEPRTMRVRRRAGAGNAMAITTAPWPGFPTDMQSVLTTLLGLTPGYSTISETIYPDRFNHVPELCRMGAQIERERSSIIIRGVEAYEGAAVMASDLRAGAALVLAALAAEGRSQVRRVYHIERGYEAMPEKLAALGAHIERIPESGVDPGLEAELLGTSEG